MKRNGFTIIELIVVIAVIAVLATIVSVSVKVYITKGKDSAIKENLNSLTTNSLIYLESHGNYGAFCNDEAVLRVEDKMNPDNSYCHHSDTQWVFCSRLYENSSKAWCIDSTGAKKQINDSACKNGLSLCP